MSRRKATTASLGTISSAEGDRESSSHVPLADLAKYAQAARKSPPGDFDDGIARFVEHLEALSETFGWDHLNVSDAFGVGFDFGFERALDEVRMNLRQFIGGDR